MAGARNPGPEGLGAQVADDGRVCLLPGSPPGPTGVRDDSAAANCWPRFDVKTSVGRIEIAPPAEFAASEVPVLETVGAQGTPTEAPSERHATGLELPEHRRRRRVEFTTAIGASRYLSSLLLSDDELAGLQQQVQRVSAVPAVVGAGSVIDAAAQALVLRELQLFRTPPARGGGGGTPQKPDDPERRKGNQRFMVNAKRTENTSPRYSVVPGVYSELDLAPGAELVGFSRRLGGAAAAAMTEPACFSLAPAGTAAADVAFADTRPGLDQPLAEQLAGLQIHRAEFGAYFVGYLVDRAPEGFFGAGGDLDAVLDVLRAPELAPDTRLLLCDGLVERIVQYSPIDESALQQCVLGLLRLLLLPEAADLHANLVQTWLPNLVGLEGSMAPHAAAQLVPEAALRARVAAAVAHGAGGVGAGSALGAWLAA